MHCTLCIGFPEETDVDHLIASHCVVLARESEIDPFTYAPRQVLKGAFDGAEINLLVDSMTRRILSANPARQVLLVQSDIGSPWRSLGLVSDDYLAVVRRVVLFAEAWQGKDGAQRRWEFFVPLFGHNDPRIRQLAYLEVGRAPYAVIQNLGRTAPRESYETLLRDPKYIQWRSLAILLLAQSDAPQDQQTIRESFYRAHQLAITNNLAAWAAAAIEVDGVRAIDFIKDNYSGQTDRSVAEIRAIAKALSMHGSQVNSDLRNRIVASYRVLLQSYPQIAPDIADDLFAWQQYSLTDELAQILQATAGFDTTQQHSIRRYLRAAAAAELTLVPD